MLLKSVLAAIVRCAQQYEMALTPGQGMAWRMIRKQWNVAELCAAMLRTALTAMQSLPMQNSYNFSTSSGAGTEVAEISAMAAAVVSRASSLLVRSAHVDAKSSQNRANLIRASNNENELKKCDEIIHAICKDDPNNKSSLENAARDEARTARARAGNPGILWACIKGSDLVSALVAWLDATTAVQSSHHCPIMHVLASLARHPDPAQALVGQGLMARLVSPILSADFVVQPVNEEAVRAEVGEVDINSDGLVTQSEFVTIMSFLGLLSEADAEREAEVLIPYEGLHTEVFLKMVIAKKMKGAVQLPSGTMYASPYGAISVVESNEVLTALPVHIRWCYTVQIMTALVRLCGGGSDTSVLGNAFAFLRSHAKRIGAAMEHLSSPSFPVTAAGLEEQLALCNLFGELCIHKELWYHHANAQVVAGIRSLLMRKLYLPFNQTLHICLCFVSMPFQISLYRDCALSPTCSTCTVSLIHSVVLTCLLTC